MTVNSMPLSFPPGLLGRGSPLPTIEQLIATYGGLCYPFQETSGSTASVINSALAVGRNIALNNGFDSDTIWTKGTGWTIAAGVAHQDGTGTGAVLYQNVAVAGREYKVTFTIKNYSAGSVKIYVGASGGGTFNGNGTYSDTMTATGSIAGVRSVGFSGDIDDLTIQQVNIPANDSAMNGAITGATVGVSAGGTLGRAYSFDGATSYVNAYSQTFNSFFNPDAGTLIVFAKVANAGVWTDGVARRLAYIRADDGNRVILQKTTTNNEIVLNYIAGGSNKSVTTTTSSTNWIFLALTWDTVAGEVKAYVNGAQVGTTQTSPGTWSGNLASTEVAIGATNTTPQGVHSGLIAYPTLLRGAATPAEILTLAKAAGVA